MSCMVTTVPAPVTRANAAPIASAAPSSSWSGTTPLMSYALKMLARSPNARPASRDTTGAPLACGGTAEPIGPAEDLSAAPARWPRRPTSTPWPTGSLSLAGPVGPGPRGLSSPRWPALPGHRPGPGPARPAAARHPSRAARRAGRRASRTGHSCAAPRRRPAARGPPSSRGTRRSACTQEDACMRCVSSNGNENPPVHLAHITQGTHAPERGRCRYNRDGICPRPVKPSPEASCRGRVALCAACPSRASPPGGPPGWRGFPL